MNLKQIWEKYSDAIPYIFFGVCTTGVNVLAYWLCAHLFGLTVMLSTIVAWVLAVLFAYITNRKWVFHSEARSFEDIMKEGASFFGCRLATGVLDWTCMFVFVKILCWNDLLIKVIANIAVIVLNYIASKFFIFKRGNNDEQIKQI